MPLLSHLFAGPMALPLQPLWRIRMRSCPSSALGRQSTPRCVASQRSSAPPPCFAASHADHPDSAVLHAICTNLHAATCTCLLPPPLCCTCHARATELLRPRPSPPAQVFNFLCEFMCTTALVFGARMMVGLVGTCLECCVVPRPQLNSAPACVGTPLSHAMLLARPAPSPFAG